MWLELGWKLFDFLEVGALASFAIGTIIYFAWPDSKKINQGVALSQHGKRVAEKTIKYTLK